MSIASTWHVGSVARWYRSDDDVPANSSMCHLTGSGVGVIVGVGSCVLCIGGRGALLVLGSEPAVGGAVIDVGASVGSVVCTPADSVLRGCSNQLLVACRSVGTGAGALAGIVIACLSCECGTIVFTTFCTALTIGRLLFAAGTRTIPPLMS